MDWDAWWWDGAADPDTPRPSIEVHTTKPRPLPKPRVKDGKPLKRYVHRFGIQPRPVEVKARRT